MAERVGRSHGSIYVRSIKKAEICGARTVPDRLQRVRASPGRVCAYLRGIGDADGSQSPGARVALPPPVTQMEVAAHTIPVIVVS